MGDRIRQLRKEKDLSQYDLADISGVQRQTINLIENKKVKKVEYWVVKSLATALQVTPEELTGEPLKTNNSHRELLEKLEQAHSIIDEVIAQIKQME